MRGLASSRLHALSDIKVAVQHPSSFPVTERESIASLK